MYVYLFFIFIVIGFLPVSATETPHKIVCLLSGPRSLSTVFMRMMKARGDFEVYHEPLTAMFAREVIPEISKGWYPNDCYSTFGDFESDMYKTALEKNVFIKEMSFAFYKQIVKAQAFIKNPSVHFILLVRNPHHSAISFYRRIHVVQAKQSEVIGLKDLYEEYELLRKLNPANVKIVFSEQLYTAPRKVNSAICEYLSIPFLKKSLTWKSYDQDFDPKGQWNDDKRPDIVLDWHGAAIKSTSIGRPHEYEVDDKGNPTFSEIENLKHREKYKEAYLDNLVYYKKFLEAKEDFLLGDF